MKDSKKVINGLIYALVIGIICGAVGVAYNYLIKYTGVLRGKFPIWLAMVVMLILGPVIIRVNKWFKVKDFKATEGIIQAIRDDSDLDIKITPAAVVGLALTCLAESSGCKEGGSFQIGAPIAHWIGRKLNIEAPEKRILTMCAVAAGFAAILGLPFFGAVLAAEVAFNRLEVKYLPYTAVSAAASYLLMLLCKAPKLRYAVDFSAPGPFLHMLGFAVIAAVAGLLGRAFLYILDYAGKGTGLVKNTDVRVVAGGLIAAVRVLIINSQVYLSGGNVISAALAGTGNWYDFILKIFFLALLSKVGYKTGLLPQTIVIGGAFGGAVAALAGIDPAIGAAAGIVGIVGGVSCCPAATFFLGLNLFKFSWQGIIFCAVFAALGVICGGNHAYYANKKPSVTVKKTDAPSK